MLFDYRATEFSYGYVVRQGKLQISSTIHNISLQSINSNHCNMLLMELVIFFDWLLIVSGMPKVKFGLQNFTGRGKDYRIKVITGVSSWYC